MTLPGGGGGGTGVISSELADADAPEVLAAQLAARAHEAYAVGPGRYLPPRHGPPTRVVNRGLDSSTSQLYVGRLWSLKHRNHAALKGAYVEPKSGRVKAPGCEAPF